MTTIYTATLSGADSGNEGLSFRNVLTITGGAQGQVRVTFKAATGANLKADHASIGISTGTLSNTTATPVELTFAGSSGFNAVSGASVTSDWVNLAGFTSSDHLVVIIDINSTAGSGANADTTAVGAGALYFGSGASFANTTPGYALGNSNYSFVSLVEVQSAAVVTPVATLMGFGIPRLPVRKPRNLIIPGTAVPPPAAPVVLVAQPIAHGIRRVGFRKSLPVPFSAALPVTSAAVTTPLVQIVGSTLNDNNGISGNAFQFNLPNPTLSGNCLVLVLAYPFKSGRTISIVDSAGDTWPAATITAGTAALSNMNVGIYVLPSATAALHTLTITFDAAIRPFQYTLAEFYNIATASAADGTHSAASSAGPNVSAGSFTPSTNNDANGGHLIFNYAISNDTVGTNVANQASAMSATNSASLLHADNNCTIPSVSSYSVQAVNAAINPGFSITQSSGTNFVCASVALKIAVAGNAPAAGIRIVRLLHTSVVNPQTGDNTVLFPCDGNLRVATMAAGNNLNVFNSVKDTDNSGGYTVRTFAAGDSQVFESANTTANNANVVTLNLAAGEPQFSMHLLDITGADPSPFMNTSGFNGAAPGSGTVFNDFPDHTPNANVSGLTIVQTGMGTAGPQFGFASGAPSGAIFDNVFYTGMTDADRMDNADPFGHVYFSSNTAQTWNWLFNSAAPGAAGSTAFATAISYKSGTIVTTAALLARSIATVFGKLTFAGKSSLAAQSISAAEGSAGIAGKTSLAGASRSSATLGGGVAIAVKLSAVALSQFKSAASAAGKAALTGAGKLQAVARSAGTFTFALAARALAASSAKSSPLFAAKLSATGLSQAKASASLAGKTALTAATRAALQIRAAITASSAGAVALLAISLIKSSAAALIAGRTPLSAKAQVNSSARAGASFTARLSAATIGMLKAGANVSGTIALAAKTAMAGFGRLVPPGSIALIARAFGKMVAVATFSGKTPLIATAKAQGSASAAIAGRTALAALSRSAASARASFVSLIRLAASSSISSTARATISARAALSGVARATSIARLTLVGKLQLAARATVQSSGTGNVVGIAPLVGIAGRTLIKFAARGLLLVFDPSPRFARALFENRLVSALFENRSASATAAPENRTAVAPPEE